MEDRSRTPRQIAPIDGSGLGAHLRANFDWQVVMVTFEELEGLLDHSLPTKHRRSLAWWEEVARSAWWVRETRGRITHVDVERCQVSFRAVEVSVLPSLAAYVRLVLVAAGNRSPI